MPCKVDETGSGISSVPLVAQVTEDLRRTRSRWRPRSTGTGAFTAHAVHCLSTAFRHEDAAIFARASAAFCRGGAAFRSFPTACQLLFVVKTLPVARASTAVHRQDAAFNRASTQVKHAKQCNTVAVFEHTHRAQPWRWGGRGRLRLPAARCATKETPRRWCSIGVGISSLPVFRRPRPAGMGRQVRRAGGSVGARCATKEMPWVETRGKCSVLGSASVS